MATRFRWAGTVAFAATETRVQLHEGLAIVSSMIVQVVLLVFVLILARSLLPFALVGAIVYSVFRVGQRIQNEAAYIRIDHKLTELYHASPLSAEAYFLGMSAGVLLAYLPPILVLVAAGIVLVPIGASGALVLVATLVAVWLFAGSMGYIISTLFRTQKAIWPYASLITNAFGVLPPVFFPLWLIPSATGRTLALLVPTSASVALVERAARILPLAPGEVAIAATSLAVETAAMFVAGILWARRAAREA